MNCQEPAQSETVDELLSLLANSDCRTTLAHFRDSSDDEVTLESLANELRGRVADDQARVAQRLHHEALPKLDAVDAVEYDAGSNTVRYRGHDGLETMLDGVQEATRRMD